MNWKLLKSEYLFKDLWFTVRKDTCERSGGQIVDPYYVYEFPEWVTAVAITKEGKFIFERQYRHAAGLTMLEIPGGCVDPGDQNLQAAISRELKEETGYTFKEYTYLGKTSANRLGLLVVSPSTNRSTIRKYKTCACKSLRSRAAALLSTCPLANGIIKSLLTAVSFAA